MKIPVMPTPMPRRCSRIWKDRFDNSTRPLHDVIAIILGSTYPDQRIIYGNHHDA
jgi:hypothetical protein